MVVGRKSTFELGVLTGGGGRCRHNRTPAQPFSGFVAATVGGLAYGQTVLSKAVMAADLEFDTREAHSAVYDAERTAELFCRIVNRWNRLQTLEAELVGPDATL